MSGLPGQRDLLHDLQRREVKHDDAVVTDSGTVLCLRDVEAIFRSHEREPDRIQVGVTDLQVHGIHNLPCGYVNHVKAAKVGVPADVNELSCCIDR